MIGFINAPKQPQEIKDEIEYLEAVEQIKGDVTAVLPGDVIQSISRQLEYDWRERSVGPVTMTVSVQ